MFTLAVTKPECWHGNFITLLAVSSFNWNHQHALASCFRDQI